MAAVLIVEDDAIIRSDIQSLLEEEGYRVVTAGSAQDALAKLAESSDIGVILLDLGLPDADGAEFRSLQLALPEHSEVPVVLLSGQSDLAATAKRLGAAGYLRKPFRIQALFEVVARYCSLRTAERLSSS